MSRPSERLLLVNPNWLGDALFSTPAIRALRKSRPHAHIGCLLPPRVRGVLVRNPHLNELIEYDDHAKLWSVGECARIIARIRRGRYDTAIFFHRSKTKVLLAKMAGISQRIGYEGPGRGFLLTRSIAIPAEPAHKIDLFLNLLSAWGVPPDGRHMEFVPDPDQTRSLRELLSQHGIEQGERYFVVHAGGNWPLKRWPPGHFIESIRLMSKEFGFKAVLCGTASEQAICEEIRAAFKPEEVVSLCGKTSLDQLALLMKDAEFVVSNDSGPLHLAASQKTKILGLFGPTAPSLTGPASLAPMRILSKDVGCEVPCYYRACDYRVCMDWLTPEEVLKSSKELVHG